MKLKATKVARGKFITFEGGEGAGKSTQIAILVKALESQGIECVQTREPGGCQSAERIRDMLVKGDIDTWTGMTEALMMTAARTEHVSQIIEPALSAGKWVICDRFFDSTVAYQGAGRGVGISTVRDMQRLALGDLKPDLTLIFNLPTNIGLQRAGKREEIIDSGEDRFERMGGEFHQTLAKAFLDIAATEPKRCKVIDASKTIYEVSGDILTILSVELGLKA